MNPITAGTHEFEVDLDEEGQGTLLLTDLELLFRPTPTTEKLYRQSPFDDAHIWRIMSLGDDDSGGYGITWYVATRLPASQAASRMHHSWHAYFNGYCAANVWIDVDVCYIGAGGRTLFTRGYGFSDDYNVRGRVYVYCREFWEELDPSGDSAVADWRLFLKRLAPSEQPVRLDQLEERLAAGLSVGYPGISRLIVVRPAENPNGYTARGFELIVDD